MSIENILKTKTVTVLQKGVITTECCGVNVSVTPSGGSEVTLQFGAYEPAVQFARADDLRELDVAFNKMADALES